MVVVSLGVFPPNVGGDNTYTDPSLYCNHEIQKLS